MSFENPTKGGTAPLEPPERKDVKIQGVKLRATRNPTLEFRPPVEYFRESSEAWPQLRSADRRFLGV